MKRRLYSETFEDCYNPHCKNPSEYYGEEATCSKYVWSEGDKGRHMRWSTCNPKANEYKTSGLGYRAIDAATSYVGIRECMKSQIDDEWCQNCNSGK